MGKVLRKTMPDDLDKILDGGSGPTGPSAEDQAKAKQAELDKQTLAKQQHLDNINKALAEEEAKLAKVREEAAKAKDQPGGTELKIDENDPNSKAWLKRIQEEAIKTVSPVTANLELEKKEVFTATLREFLQDKPALAASADKLKEFNDEYERLSKDRITGKTKEGVLLYLNKAFASVYNDQLIEAARQGRIDAARQSEMFSAPAIDGGSTSYKNEMPRRPLLSDSDKAQLAAWHMTEDEWWAMKAPKKEEAKK
jgi:DNA repair exonuclease SbcCD ATPase subunit